MEWARTGASGGRCVAAGDRATAGDQSADGAAAVCGERAAAVSALAGGLAARSLRRSAARADRGVAAPVGPHRRSVSLAKYAARRSSRLSRTTPHARPASCSPSRSHRPPPRHPLAKRFPMQLQPPRRRASCSPSRSHRPPPSAPTCETIPDATPTAAPSVIDSPPSRRAASCERRTPRTVDRSQVERDHERGHELRNSKRIYHHPNVSNKPN